MRAGAEFFTAPSGSAQRRYEAMRAYFVDERPAAAVADQFGYSTASVHQMATLLRSGRMRLFADARPGPKGPTKATGPVREQVLALRARHLAVTEIAAILTREGIPISAQTVWKICQAEGLARLRGDDTPAARPAASRPSKPLRWAAGRPRQRTCAVITPGCCCWHRPWPSSACTS
jgi:transposase